MRISKVSDLNSEKKYKKKLCQEHRLQIGLPKLDTDIVNASSNADTLNLDFKSSIRKNLLGVLTSKLALQRLIQMQWISNVNIKYLEFEFCVYKNIPLKISPPKHTLQSGFGVNTRHKCEGKNQKGKKKQTNSTLNCFFPQTKTTCVSHS